MKRELWLYMDVLPLTGADEPAPLAKLLTSVVLNIEPARDLTLILTNPLSDEEMQVTIEQVAYHTAEQYYRCDCYAYRVLPGSDLAYLAGYGWERQDEATAEAA